MQRFEITIDGITQPGDFATQDEANRAADKLRQQNDGKTVAVRPKAGSPQGTPGNPAGSEQR